MFAGAQAGKLDPTFSTGGIFTDSSGEFDNMGTFGNVVASTLKQTVTQLKC